MSSIKTKSNKKDRLKLSDCTCPICLEITIQPVDMPCKHEICLKCFDTMIDQTNLCCPMCRLNIGDWSRQARLTNKLINIEKWKLIKESFPVEIKNRLEGKQTDILNETTVHVKCARKGEIRKEYLDLIKREEENLRKEKESEEKLSLACIEQIIRQEDSLDLQQYIEIEKSLNLYTTNVQEPLQSMPSTSKRSRRSKTPNEEFTRITRSKSMKLQQTRDESTTNIEQLPLTTSSDPLNEAIIEDVEIIHLPTTSSSLTAIINNQPLGLVVNNKRKAEDDNQDNSQSSKRINSEQQQPQQATSNNQIFVGSLKMHIQENDLVNHFKCFGSIIKAEIIRNWNTNGQSRGFGFVTFHYPSSVDRVLSSGMHFIDGKPARVNIALPKGHHQQPRSFNFQTFI